MRHHRRTQRRQHPRPRRTIGKKSKNAKMAAVGVLYTLKQTKDELEGPINKRVYSTFESYRALFEWLLREATKRGYGTARFKGSSGKSVGKTGTYDEKKIASCKVDALRRRRRAVAPCSLGSRLSASLRPAARAPSAALTRAARGA
ncbi:MAG: hypothetical protein JO347_09715 [Candidatus Eremiobacteraeota bacterium]|nr:hypothetical protein [Candidatus Eremiobacteraeota bacterium]